MTLTEAFENIKAAIENDGDVAAAVVDVVKALFAELFNYIEKTLGLAE